MVIGVWNGVVRTSGVATGGCSRRRPKSLPGTDEPAGTSTVSDAGEVRDVPVGVVTLTV